LRLELINLSFSEGKMNKTNKQFGVYGIYYNDNLLYIGSTDNFERRKKEHIKKLKSGKHNKRLQKYFDDNVGNTDLLEFRMVHETLDSSKVRLFFAELICIYIMKPLCNRPVIQLGMKYLSLGNPIVNFDEEILKYL